MERLTRKPFQGITNIIRFNWHYYIIALAVIAALLFVETFLNEQWKIVVLIVAALTILSIIISLIVSWYIYDCSGLYAFTWLEDLNIKAGQQLININAGFDETSFILANKFPHAHLLVFDFYDPQKHTEISIKRARKFYSAFPGTVEIDTNHLPLKVNSVDYVFLFFAAHEIRDHQERIGFFKQLKNCLSENGRIIVVEHQRDLYNFIAYNFGFFHFLSRKIWDKTFAMAGLFEISKTKINSFVSTFILTKNAITS